MIRSVLAAYRCSPADNRGELGWTAPGAPTIFAVSRTASAPVAGVMDTITLVSGV